MNFVFQLSQHGYLHRVVYGKNDHKEKYQRSGFCLMSIESDKMNNNNKYY